jgi:hypothetical protein
MATTKNGTASRRTTSTQGAVDQAKTIADKALAVSKRTTAANIDSYERSVRTFVDFEHKVADAIDVEPISSITNAYAELTREIGTVQASAARSLLRV